MPHNDFIQHAFQSLIDRGVAEAGRFSPSPVTDSDLAQFEARFQVRLPSFLRAYLKSYCYDFNYIRAPVPEDIDPYAIQTGDCDLILLWLDLLSVPKGNPLRNLYHRMELFREEATCELIGMCPESISHLLPIGDWYAGAGPLCIDLTCSEGSIDIRNRDTWSLQFFDHEEFDWASCYLDADGLARGERVAPEFQSLIEWYFCGAFDRVYETQESVKIDYSTLIRL